MSKVRLALGLLIALLIFPSIGPYSSLDPFRKAHASTTTITLYAALSGWNYSKPSGPNPTITLTQGDIVSFNLISEDSYSPHLLLLDFDRNGVTNDCSGGQDKCSGNIPAGSGTGSIASFIVTANPGMYNYYCLYHSPTNMVGTLKVQSPGSDYGVSSSPSSLTIPQSSNANSTVSVASINGFSGQVTLSATTPASWPTPFFSVNPVTISGGMTSTSELTIYTPATASPGPYTVSVTASNSSTFSHSIDIPVTVPSQAFAVSANPASLTINSGSAGTATVVVTGSNGFSGTVSLATSIASGRGTATLYPTSVVLSSTSSSLTSMLTVSSPLGMFNVSITGTSSGISHSTQVLVNGPDFTVKTSSAAISIDQGSSSMLTLTLTSVNGLSGTVALSVFSSPGSPLVSVSPSILQIPSTASAFATLTVTAVFSGANSTPVSPGSYTITLNATMGSLSHVTSVSLTVTSPPFGARLLTNPIFIDGVVGAVAVVAVLAYLLSRKAKRPNT